MPNKQSDLDNVFRALSDRTRRAVLQRLTHGPASVTELATRFDMALPSFVQHLKVLEESGLIRSQKTGRVRRCEIEPKALRHAQTWLAEQNEIWEKRLDQFDEYVKKLKNKENT